ncbi:pyruvate:ferredoxin (flavodoxin) oxidoreductase [Tautonia sociabilis]|uniref:Pyruvate:ferredoxin (Flavodoxin) oxidoreductase n=1 Tax=Tautonia sociabilis TaxID=2080755 RepID=A0A432MGE3_9BACT|nr:pyruvate:ferredoxin (flavodoxin) oxidoreductase [Tautonia sociabilis]RUL85633.1 pyruvate:ferredoxin (flavodoxin) oxidoreductase [Tautonia sociabilis]
MDRRSVTIDGNEAAAHVAHLTSEVIAIYPITPASPMGELADAWSAASRPNIFGVVPDVIEMQSEAGAAGAVHGSLQAGALTTTFTASQGLLLMIPNLFKIAGELTSTVFHIAARSVATHALSIFGDHSDVMACRSTGWAMLASSSVQEAQDLAMVAQMATLEGRVPVLHFFDGFRTSHEVNKIEQLTPDDARALIDKDLVRAHRERAMSPDRPVLRGSAQNPDVFFQAREASNPFYDAMPGIVQRAMDRFADRVGRRYRLFDYEGAPDADRVVVVMGSAAGTVSQAVSYLNGRGEKVGVVKVRLFRPFSVEAFAETLPETVRSIAVLDRTKEPGAIGEPLYQDVVTALVEARGGDGAMPRVLGGRYGLSSKEFTPSMAVAVFDELKAEAPKRRFTVGIVDDVTHLSLKHDPALSTEPDDVTRAIFYGLGSDGTVGANKNSVKIIGEQTPLYAQGYFVYDSKKSGAITISHLRFGPRPIDSPYLITRANFVACHQEAFLERIDVLEAAEPGATFLLNSSRGPEEVWDTLPAELQREIVEKRLKFFVVDAYRVASEAGLGPRINTVMQTCFFALAGILPKEEAIAHIKDAIRKTYGRRGDVVLERNFAAVDAALAALHEVAVPAEVTGSRHRLPTVSGNVPDFVARVTALMMAGKGDLLPVSALPVDGTFPTGTAKYEKRSIAQEIPIWDPDLCIQCGLCAYVCPHATIRTKVFDPSALRGLDGKAGEFPSRPWKGKEFPGQHLSIQVYPDDCTGCGVCVDICPAVSKEVAKHKAINMEAKTENVLRVERARLEVFEALPFADRSAVKAETVKGSQLLQPLFEFSGACAGCGETPYLRLMSQLFGDRAMIANATGCSSIYGGNLPTTPYATNAEGRGPTWSNSLFEDNAEFGLGFRLAVDQLEEYARTLLRGFSAKVGDDLVRAILEADQREEDGIRAQRERVAALKRALEGVEGAEAASLVAVADALVRRSVWIVGGDGWAYDIGFGGLDHVLTSGRDVNILVLDTEVYSNTGGQASKATPRGAVAKFAAQGKGVAKKDLGMIAVDYGNVYVAQVAIGANPLQTLKAFREAESYPGVSLILAYSHCIAHGIPMATAMSHQKDATASGYWPLFRHDPRLAGEGKTPFHLDSRKPTLPFQEFAMKEARYAMLSRTDPRRADFLLRLAQRDIDERWHFYEQMAGVERTVPERGVVGVVS